jgi:hypothetical protein
VAHLFQEFGIARVPRHERPAIKVFLDHDGRVLQGLVMRDNRLMPEERMFTSLTHTVVVSERLRRVVNVAHTTSPDSFGSVTITHRWPPSRLDRNVSPGRTGESSATASKGSAFC